MKREFRKLTNEDDGFDPSVDKFEMTEISQTAISPGGKFVWTLDLLEIHIQGLRDNKTKEMERWDRQIKEAEDIKNSLLKL